jgi:NADH-quinone oxidoreductase subunit N
MPKDWPALLPYLILAGGGTLIFLAGAFRPRRPGELLFALALLTALGAGAAAAMAPPRALTFLGLLDLGGYARFFNCLFAAVSVLALLFARRYGQVRGFAGDEFYGLIPLAALGMMLTAAALNWLIFFLGLELLSLCLYVLIAADKGDAAASEAGLKYFVMGAVASAFLVFGLALLYSATGTLNLAASLAHTPAGGDLPVLLLALSLVLVGVGFKLSLVPFHLWTPDVYQGAPAPVTAFLAAGSKAALAAALLRCALLTGDALWDWCLPVIWVLAALTMVAGNVTALAQTRLKRLLAYSSVAQMGYLVMALTAVKGTGAPAYVFYLAVYAVMDLGAFGLIGAFSGEKGDLDLLEDYRGLGYSQPWRAAVLALCLISLTGLPPTAGFMGKFVLFRAVLASGFVTLAVIGIFTVIISIFYYMKVVAALYLRTPEAAEAIPGPDLAIRVAGGVVLILLLWWGIAPDPVLDAAARIIAALPALA